MYGHCSFSAERPANNGLRGDWLFHFDGLGRPHGTGLRPNPNGESPLVQIFVRDNNVDQALKALKKKMQREGSFREMKRHVHYEKPSEKRARQQAEAVRRARKLARKRIQREGGMSTGRPAKA
jgi:small subunit ribosomal protein S21